MLRAATLNLHQHRFARIRAYRNLERHSRTSLHYVLPILLGSVLAVVVYVLAVPSLCRLGAAGALTGLAVATGILRDHGYRRLARTAGTVEDDYLDAENQLNDLNNRIDADQPGR